MIGGKWAESFYCQLFDLLLFLSIEAHRWRKNGKSLSFLLSIYTILLQYIYILFPIHGTILFSLL